jgi:hypothetical protein
MRRIFLVAVLGLVSGCVTAPAVGEGIQLDPQTPSKCQAHCDSLGMDLGAVVIIANSTGCVCQPRGKPSAEIGGSSAVAGGAAIFAMQRRAAENQNSSTPAGGPSPTPRPGL